MVNVLNIGVIGHQTLNMDRVNDFKDSIRGHYYAASPKEYKLTNKNIDWLFNRYDVSLGEIVAYTTYPTRQDRHTDIEPIYSYSDNVMDNEAIRIKIADWAEYMEHDTMHDLDNYVHKLIKDMRGVQISKKHRVYLTPCYNGFVLGIYMRDYLGFDCVILFESKSKKKRKGRIK